MNTGTRKLLDRAFSGLGVVSILLLAVCLLVILMPIIYKGTGAFLFRGTIEHRRLLSERFQRGDPDEIESEYEEALAAQKPVFDMIAAYEKKLKNGPPEGWDSQKYGSPESALQTLKEKLHELLGPRPDEPRSVLVREQYGRTRWDRAKALLHETLNREYYDFSDPTRMGVKVYEPWGDIYRGTMLEGLFPYLEENLDEMLKPRITLYLGFFTDEPLDSHIFGGIWPEILGTFYLTLGAVIFSVPMGVIAAIYLVEYAGDGRGISLLRTFISTLAGVPSIVFGLFGLAFFINTLKISETKSVLAGSATLALLILPTIIRASEEAIRAVPKTYKEAALSLGASHWRTVLTVILPAALPGILTGIVISVGRAAGETAPIIFTAAVSVGRPPRIWEVFDQPTPALPWNIYNLATEHEAASEIRHVQYGMVLTLVALVLLLNTTAVILRARISKKLRG